MTNGSEVGLTIVDPAEIGQNRGEVEICRFARTAKPSWAMQRTSE